MNIPTCLGLLLLLRPLLILAMHADEAGINDFVLRTAGHGQTGIRYARSLTMDDIGDIWITSQSNEHPSAISHDPISDRADNEGHHGQGIKGIQQDSSCWIAARNITTGNILWRVNACSSTHRVENKPSSLVFVPRHATFVSQNTDMVYSLDDAAILRGWYAKSGGLSMDVDVPSTLKALHANNNEQSTKDYMLRGIPRLMSTDVLLQNRTGFSLVTVLGSILSEDSLDHSYKNEYLVLHDSLTGQPLCDSKNTGSCALSAIGLLEKAKLKMRNSEVARIIDMVSLNNSNSKDHSAVGPATIAILVGWLADTNAPYYNESHLSLSSMAWVEMEVSFKIKSSASDDSIDNKEICYDVVGAVPIRIDSLSSTLISIDSLNLFSFYQKKVVMMGVSSTKSQIILTNVDIPTGKGTGKVVELDALNPNWHLITSIKIMGKENNPIEETTRLVTIGGIDKESPASCRSEGLFQLVLHGGNAPNIDLQSIHSPSNENGGSQCSILAYCSTLGVVVVASERERHPAFLTAYQINKNNSMLGASKGVSLVNIDMDGDATSFSTSRTGTFHGLRQSHTVQCNLNSMTIAYTGRGGTTLAFKLDASFSTESSKLTSKFLWSAEEALGSISSAVFLDETHAIEYIEDAMINGGDVDDEEEAALQNLKFSNRLRSQISSLKKFVFGGGIFSSLDFFALLSNETKAERDFAFGFAKISVLLSENMHRIIALDTAKKGLMLWSMNLNPVATWHKIVHGEQFNSLSDPHGYGGVHDHELLALSFISSANASYLEWKCFDGTNGRIFSEGTMTVSSPAAQIVPLRSNTHHPHEIKNCRQVALIVHTDFTVSVIPNTPQSYAVVDETVSATSRNGFFVHVIDEQTGVFRALRILRKSGSTFESNPFEVITVGTTLFDPSQEKIVSVAYPQRGEVIQSPSTVLGDDALLLKYLNPHLVVVVTEATKSFLTNLSPVSEKNEESKNLFYNALASSGADSNGQKRKPLGASKPGETLPASTDTDIPSLFVSLIDSVSGRILHRVSHAHAFPSDVTDGVSTRVPVVVSENWVVYTFFNQRTRRTDVGVLTLHEGMIDKHGMTAFTTPEQEWMFSSLESAKPIVLAKTFGIAKAITALGVTTTKAGISSKQFMFATESDQVISIDRRMLDPRRPYGELKESEKIEGLLRYAPILPIIPMRVPSHVNEVSSVRSILSAPANVESQTLIMAFGGPDIFFDRLAPSKGFDLLPDDFNRGLLTVVLLGMICFLVVIQHLNQKKMVNTVWS